MVRDEMACRPVRFPVASHPHENASTEAGVVDAAPPPNLARLAGALAADGVTAEVMEAWQRVGVRGLLIKGPTVAEWLYGEDRVRGYSDSDLLVSPLDRAVATGVLEKLGFHEEAYPDPDTSKHASPWVRDRDAAVVDLHHRLWGAWGPTAQQQWDVLLNGWTERSVVGGREVTVPTLPARLMLIALHAGQHRDLEGKPLEDLRRALALAGQEAWRSASVLADLLGASREMAAGLKRLPEGAALFERLPLLRAALLDESERSVALARARWSDARATRGSWGVIAVTLQLHPGNLRYRYPLARRGGSALMLAAAMRVVHLALRAPRAIVTVLRER
jgi:hypothetical protein